MNAWRLGPSYQNLVHFSLSHRICFTNALMKQFLLRYIIFLQYRKEDLDFSPERWELPIHLLDAVFAVALGQETMTKGEEAMRILARLKTVIDLG